MKLKRPTTGWPWEQPGYRFWNGWPTGYVPTAAYTHRNDGRTAEQHSADARKGREASAEGGRGFKA